MARLTKKDEELLTWWADIPLHPENAISTEELRILWKMNDHKAVRRALHELRLAGFWVCSNTVGIYVGCNLDEIQPFVERIEGHARSELQSIKKMKKALIKGGKE